MDQKQIEENNEMIALFMGNEIIGPGFPAGIWFNDKKKIVQFHDLKYHSSWKWLMPVVKKIDDNSNFEYDTVEYDRFEEIFHPDYTLSAFLRNDISDIWNRCVEFIKWYNENKKE